MDAAADRAGRPGPRLESRQAVRDQPAHETVDRHRRIRAHAIRRLTNDLPAARPQHEAADASVADEHIRPAAEHGDGHVMRCRGTHRSDDLVTRSRLDQRVRRPADLERRHGRQRRVAQHATGAKFRIELREQPGKVRLWRHARTSGASAVNARSRARCAERASSRETGTN